MNGASIDRIVDQSTPAKKGCSLISAAPLRPRRVSGDVKNLCGGRTRTGMYAQCQSWHSASQHCQRCGGTHLLIMSSASGLRWMSSGNCNVSLQAKIFLYVSCAFSEQKGG